ncbi:MAG: PPOX class probable FMN-dependent enzyme [Myxococcota bacterium]|jgi:PPOX class probable FMN-dependent enzyme
MDITTAAQLRAHYDAPSQRAVDKVLTRLTADHRRFLARSPFFVLGTVGSGGLDVSPRGDPPGSVLVLDEAHIAIGDRPGNRRIDGMLNLLDDPRVGLLFFIPGLNETLRLNGTARITADPALLARLSVSGKAPLTALVVTIDEVFHHCAKALMRSKLWRPEAQNPAHDKISTTPDAAYADVLY